MIWIGKYSLGKDPDRMKPVKAEPLPAFYGFLVYPASLLPLGPEIRHRLQAHGVHLREVVL